jgi:hypothetical protein
MSKVAAILEVCLVVVLVSSGAAVSAQDYRESVRAVQFDQFGQLGHCDVTGRLDGFAIQLQNQPGARGVVISYAPEGDGPGTGKQVLEMVKDYFVNTHGLAPDRIKTIYGGRNSDKYHSLTELWIVPKGASLPKPEKQETNVETFQGLFYEGGAYDDLGIEFMEEMGPGIGNSTYASIADMLQQQKNAIAYVVAYSGEDSLPAAWRRLAQEDIDRFKNYKLEPNRFKLIFGGQQKEARMQYWVLPSNAPPPVADAGSEKALAKTVKAGDFQAYNLDEEHNQKAIYSRLSEILNADKTVRAFLVVRLEQPEPEEEATEGEAQAAPIQLPEPTEPVEPPPPPLDLTKLVEKWRVDLANTHKIGPDRLIIVFTSEPYSNYLSLWIVPKGAPLPDPKEELPEAEDDPAIKP